MKINMKILFSPITMGVLFIAFALSMAVATFIENDFGAERAYQAVYAAKWFELIFLLMVINISGQIFTFRLYQRKKLPVLLFHLAFIVMIIGATVTRYTGFEGFMHIREGESSSIVMSSSKFMNVAIKDSDGKSLYESREQLKVSGSNLGNFYRETKINGNKYIIRYSRYIPNAVDRIVEVAGMEPAISFIASFGGMYRDEVVLRPGNSKTLPSLRVGFMNGDTSNVEVTIRDGEYFVISPVAFSVTNMTDQGKTDVAAGELFPFNTMMIYNIGGYSIIPQKLSMSASIVPVMSDTRTQSGINAFEVEVSEGSEMNKLYVYDIPDGTVTSSSARYGDKTVEVSYGAHTVDLPFSLELEDFVMDRYPGSSSPMGYKSNVILHDSEMGLNEPFSIFMNNILKHRSYRFYQSSYDQDEKGTVLSVNRDMAGMLITYTGYALLFLFIVIAVLNPNSLLRRANPSFWRNSSKKLIVTLALLISVPVISMANPGKIVYDKKKADEFGKVLVQDQKGRTKPLMTVSNDILRKIHRSNKYGDMSPMQVFMGYTTDFDNWKDEPIIKISNKDLKARLGVTADYISIGQLVNFETNGYALFNVMEEVYAKPQAQRSKFDKEVIKVDERVNIIMMLARGDFLKMFPLRDGTNNWGLPGQALEHATSREDSVYLSGILSLYTNALFEGKSTGDYDQADEYLQSIITYQRKFADYDLPTEGQVKAEVLYYKALIFEKLFPFYSTVGLIFVITLIVLIIRGRSDRNLLTHTLAGVVFAGFLFHTFGLGLRWYISGHSPMSNGYESLLFISWVTVLAGLLFSRKSYFALAATSVLGGLFLMVAHLSFMDPEITNLVPVLQSYWLTLHVSVITASYGFLGLGAILGLVVMILYSMVSVKNKKHLLMTIDDLTVINYRSLEFGLYLLTIGTFLGAVWANESWGRYWGWDPKETWSLITMIIYAFVIHSRMIKGLNSMFAFNAMSLWAFSSVLMTYFGVNYYLSGLHSYAAGDPVPVPSFVYFLVGGLLLITIFSYYRYGKLASVAELLEKKKGKQG